MGYVLLAMEALAAGWLAICLFAYFAGRTRSFLGRYTIDLLTWVIVPAPFVMMTVGWYLLRRFAGPWLWPLVVLNIIFLLGGVFFWIRGRRAGRASIQLDSVSEEGHLPWSPRWLVLGVAIALLLLNSTFAGLDNDIRQHLSNVRNEAETLAVSVAPRPIPDRENAAVLYIQLGDYFGRDGGPTIWPTFWDDAVRGLSPATDQPAVEGVAEKFDFSMPALAEFLKSQAGARNLIFEATARPGCHFGRDYSRPRYDMRLSEIQDMRHSIWFLAVDARHRAAKGDMQGALENIQAMNIVADHVSADPLVISVLVSIAIDGVATNSLENVLALHPASEADLATVKIDAGVSQFERMERAMRMEEAATLGVFSDFDLRGASAFGENSDLLSGWGRSSLYRVFVLPADLKSYRKFIEAATYSPGFTLKELRERQSRAIEEVDAGRVGPITSLLTPALSSVTTVVVKGEVYRRLGRVGLAMYRYRAVKGEFPESLEALSPDFLSIVPRDPFDGQPLKLRKTDRGYIVYSVGPDEVDNGGAPPKNADMEGDLLLECVAPPAANDQPKE